MNKEIIIKPKIGFIPVDFKEIWAYRELIFSLINRDFKVRYKQTLIGGFWAILQPFVTMVIFSFFFGKIAKIPSDGVPYPLFSFSGLILWSYFSNAVNNSSLSLVSNAGLISKVYFPRLILPISSSLIGIIDYFLAGLMLLVMMLFYQVQVSFMIVVLPLILLCTWLLATGIGLWLSAINVMFRDIKYLMSFLLQLWIYATPIIYPLSVAGQFKWLVLLNPMTGLIETHRAIVLNNNNYSWSTLLTSIVITMGILFSGMYFFKMIERKFADII